MIEVSNQYIDEAINGLGNLVGVKENIPYNLLNKPFKKGEIKECMEAIANYLGLPIKINLFYVSSDYSDSTEEQKFTSNQLVKTNNRGKGIEGITAQVLLPSYLPLFGTSELINFPIDVKVSKNIRGHLDTFVALIAHELSHVLLHSLRYEKKDNELYTDILPLLLGFKEVIKDGRQIRKEDTVLTGLYTTTTHIITTTYGYLSDEQFSFVYDKIDRILKQMRKNKKKLNRRINFLQKQIFLFEKKILKFKEYIKSLDKNPPKKINQKDAQKIVLLHQPGYIEEFEHFVKTIKEKLQNYQGYKSIRHYYQGWYSESNKDLISFSSNIKKNIESFEEDLKNIEKNMSFFCKFKVNLKVLFK